MSKLFRKFWLRSDERRARDTLQEICDDRVVARRRLDQLNRDADRALREAQELELERFRVSFFGRRNTVRSAFSEGSAKRFGITEPTSMVVRVRPVSVVKLARLKAAA
jgi:hypothetical protein